MTVLDPTTIAVTTDHLYRISQIVTRTSDWNEALNEIIPTIRQIIIFDNLAVYISDPITHQLEVMYARAVGRGRAAEADIAWGENFANWIVDHPQTTVREPDETEVDRLKRPYLLGIPLKVGDRHLGAVIFIRFGGPPFSPQYIELAEFITQQIGLLVEYQNLQRAYENLEAQSAESRLQEDFIATITHELRTPLGFIKGYSTTLLRSDTTWEPATQLEFLRIIDQETDRLQELIENLLDSARLQSGTLKMDFQAARLDLIIKAAAERCTIQEPGFAIQLTTEGPPSTIQGDPKRLRQVFENLFTNAIKYAHGSPVSVTIKPEQAGFLIEIEDSGPGIPFRYLPYLFERFFRNPDNSPAIHGTGLGLFICKKIILAHRGRISVSSEVGEGTTFHIWLPTLQERTGITKELEE